MSLRLRAKGTKKYTYLPLVKGLLSQTLKGRVVWKSEREEDIIDDHDGTVFHRGAWFFIASFSSFAVELQHSGSLVVNGHQVTEELLGAEGDRLLKRLITRLRIGPPYLKRVEDDLGEFLASVQVGNINPEILLDDPWEAVSEPTS